MKKLLALLLIPSLLFAAAGDIKVSHKSPSDNAWTSTIYAKLNNGFMGMDATGLPAAPPNFTWTDDTLNLYNTADQTTNYERLSISWATDIVTISSEKGGSGTLREFKLGPVTLTGALTTDSSAGTAGQVLESQGAGLEPTWATSGGSGDVVGPASATDNAIVRFDSTTGKLVQDSLVTISDTGDVTVDTGVIYGAEDISQSSTPYIDINSNDAIGGDIDIVGGPVGAVHIKQSDHGASLILTHNGTTGINGGKVTTSLYNLAVDSHTSYSVILNRILDVGGTGAGSGIISVLAPDIETTSTEILRLENTEAADAVATVQMSPALYFRGHAWDTAASQSVDFFMENLPTTAATPTGTLKFGYSLDGAAATYPMTLTSAGDLTATGEIVGSGNYASIYVEGGSTSIDMPTAGTFVKLTQFTTDGEDNISIADAANDQITVDSVGGVYNISFGISFSGTNNATITLKVYAGGVAIPGLTGTRKLGTGGDVGRFTLTDLAVRLAADADIDVRATGDSNGDDLVAVDMTLSVSKIGL